MIGKITKGDTMEFVNKVENRVATWYEKAPHLPLGGRQWLGTNVWWIVLVGTIIGAFGILNIIFFGALTALFVVGFGGPVGAAIVGVAAIIAVIALAGAILETIITALAIKPLKDKQKKGWSLLLLALIVALGFVLLTFLFSFDLSSLIISLLWAAVVGYFLFEIRDQFGPVAIKVKPAKKTPKFVPAEDTKTK
jgi:uncharacterized membrane protein YhaH (DUF805 family)